LGAEATTAETEAQTGKATAPYAAPQAQSKTRLGAAEATSAETKAETEKATAPLAAPTAQAKLQEIQANINSIDVGTKVTSMGIYQKQIAMAEAGDVQGAVAVAQQAGIKGIDAETLQNAQARGTLKEIIATSQQRNPGKPAQQFDYVAGQIARLHLQNQPGAQLYAPVPGAPPPSETGSASQGETERIMASIKAEHPDWPQEKIVAAAHGRVDQQRIETERLAQHAATSDPAYRRDPAGTIKKWREYYGMQPQGGGQQQYSNGATATNLQTGQKIVFSNGQWVDASSGKPINAPAAPQPAQAPAGAQASAAPPRPAYQPGQQPAAPAPEIPL